MQPTPRKTAGARAPHVLIGILLLACFAAGGEPDGSIAEPGRWNGPRGTPAGTFRSAAMPILTDAEEAWSFALPGPAAGAPVLCDGVAYLVCSDGKRRVLLAIDLLTGEPRAKKSLPDGPLAPPVVADGLAIVKASEKQLIGYGLGRSSFSQRWKTDLRDATHLSDPLVIDDEVYVIKNGAYLVRLQPRKREPVWTTRDRYDFAGTPAACGAHVFALHHAETAGYAPSLHLVTFRRETGSVTGRTNVAWYQSKDLPSDTTGASISIMADEVFVTSSAPLRSNAGGRSYASLPCILGPESVRFEDRVGLQQIVAPPSWSPTGSLYLIQDERGLAWDVQVKDKIFRLTDQSDQPDLVRHRLPATVFGRVAYFGWWAADLETKEVLWRLPVANPRFAVVPADRMALVVDGENLRAFREKGSAGPGAIRGKGSVPAALAVGRDGDLLEGELTVSFDEEQIVEGKKTYNLRAYYVVEGEGDKLVWAPDFPGRLRGYELLARARLRTAMARLATDAAKAKAAVAQRYLDAAESAGLEGDEAEKLEKRVERALRKPKTADPEKLEAWEADAARARAILPELLARRAAVELESGDAEVGLRLLRASLNRDANCAPALALLAARAPKEFKLGSARFWLDLHLDLLQAGAQLASDDELELKRARYHWRKDVYALQAGPILLITPARDTRVVGRCLAYGRLTCGMLGELFATDDPHRRKAAPLVIHLFESRKEYETKSGLYDSFEDPEFLKWSAGHYAPSESVSRFFWFEDPRVERRVAATCVHEVTHHWLREQCPRYASSQIRRGPNAPGHWIVEGFAAFVEEGIYDPENGTWDLFNPRWRALDYVRALARTNQLIDWTRLYALTATDFKTLGNKSDRAVVSRWMLGRPKLSERSVFYKQASATCAFLYFGDGGKYRKKLLDFVVDCYMGNADKLTPEAAFGMTGPELGARVLAFAKQVAEGWRPEQR